MLEPLGEHILLPFILQLLLLLFAARLLGEVARRFDQPSVVGELSAGLLLGPSVFERVLPDVAAFVFPGGEVESTLILGVAQLGVLLLLLTTGFETDLQLIRRLGRTSVTTSAASLLVPLVAGFATGLALPDEFVGAGANQVIFALFLAVAVSISALAVSGRILTEMDLMRRDIGQVIVGVAMANELVGWVLLGLLTSIVLSGGLDVGALLLTVGLLSSFLVGALTVGQRLVDGALRGVLSLKTGIRGAFTANVVIALAAAAVTQAIGVEAALGAFVAGVVLGRSRYQREDVSHALDLTTQTVFAPIFFATAGIFVDVGAIATPRRLTWFVVILLVAVAAKFIGSYLGTRWGGRDHATAIALGVGLNARGTLEIVLATIALSLGVFNAVAYSTVVLVAMISALVTPPLLRAALARVHPEPSEAERLEREEVLATSVIASTSRALLPTRGGVNAAVVASTLDLILQPEAVVTVLTVHDPDADIASCNCDDALDSAASRFANRTAECRRLTSSDPAAAILAEADLGYGLVGVGLTEEFRDTHQMSSVLRALISHSKVPLLLVRHAVGGAPGVTDAKRILVPVTGVRTGRAAEEVGAVMAAGLGASLDLVHVVTRSDRGADTGQRVPVSASVGGRGEGTEAAASSVLDQAVKRARRFGATAEGSARTGAVTPEAILAAANDLGSDLIVLSARSRAVEGQPFLGHGTEYLLEHARQTVVTVVFPPENDSAD